MKLLTPADVQSALVAKGLTTRIQTFETSTATSAQAAQSIGTSLGSIVKSLVFMVGEQPVVILASGDQKIDNRKLAAIYSVSRKKVKIASEEQCVLHVGFALGGVPPIGHRTQVPIYIDQTLARFEIVYAAAGSPNTIFPIALSTLVQVTDGKVVDLVVSTANKD